MRIVLIIFLKTIDWHLSVKTFLYLEYYLFTFKKVIGAYLKKVSFSFGDKSLLV
jgi:hypothetical protein